MLLSSQAAETIPAVETSPTAETSLAAETALIDLFFVNCRKMSRYAFFLVSPAKGSKIMLFGSQT